MPSASSQKAQTVKKDPKDCTDAEIEAAIDKFKVKYIEVEDKKTGQMKQKMVVPDDWEFCKPCGAHLRNQQVLWID